MVHQTLTPEVLNEVRVAAVPEPVNVVKTRPILPFWYSTIIMAPEKIITGR
jgi:hypothetical protein